MFKDIIGQDKLKNYLDKEIKNETLSYGYIIEGDRFMGKEFIAEQIAEEITVPSYITKVLPTEDRKLMHIDDIRALKEDAYSQSFRGSKKVYIIPNADDMGNGSQNAFLKVLEEPPQACVFILLVENRNNLLSTIRSRCTNLKLDRYQDSEIKQYLEKCDLVYDREIVRLCDGTLNKYLFLASKEFQDISELSFRILYNIKILHTARLFAIFKHIQAKKEYVQDILDLFLLWYRDLYIYKITKDITTVEFSSRQEQIIKNSELYQLTEILNILSEILKAKNKLNYNCNLEMTINTLLFYMKGVAK